MISERDFTNLKKMLDQEIKIIKELASFSRKNESEKSPLISSHINALKEHLEVSKENITSSINKISIPKPLVTKKVTEETPSGKVSYTKPIQKSGKPIKINPVTLKRILKKEKKIEKKKEMKPSSYIKTANKLFSKYAITLLEKGRFRTLKRDLVKANLRILPKSYVSILFFTTLLSVFAGIFLFVFFLFFNIGVELPIITLSNDQMFSRFLKVFWILLVVPIGTFLFTYFYPSMEKQSIGNKINQELPFATIHMSSISGSMIDPSKIFSIIIETGEYVYLKKELVKLLNEMNVFGHDLVTALRKQAFNCPSKKLSELFNGIATTITSGGDLPEFFDKRASSLLFDYRLEREKYTKTAETFMDIYISVVIAAPMILMLLVMMMRVSGLGISLSTPMITLVMVLGVSVINVIFLVFLQLKQPEG